MQFADTLRGKAMPRDLPRFIDRTTHEDHFYHSIKGYEHLVKSLDIFTGEVKFKDVYISDKAADVILAAQKQFIQDIRS
jgi:hypothetical protein